MKIIDCDSHVLPQTMFQNIPQEHRVNTPRFTFSEEGKLLDVICGRDPIGVAENTSPASAFGEIAGMTNITQRIKDFKKLQITKQLLGPQEWAMRFNYSVDPKLAVEMCKDFNNEVKKIVDSYHEYFFAAAVLPLQNMPEAVKELNRAISNGFKIIYVDQTFHTRDANMCISQVPGIDEVFDICQKNNVVVFFHGMMHHTYPFQDLYRNISHFLPTPIQLNLYSLIADGVFDRFPTLQVVFAEGADVVAPGVFKVIEQVYNYRRLSNHLKRTPLEYFKNNISFTIDIERTQSFNFLLKTFGSERLLFSTDYPHDDDSGKNQLNDVNDLLALNLPQADLENIAYKNAERLFQLL